MSSLFTRWIAGRLGKRAVRNLVKHHIKYHGVTRRKARPARARKDLSERPDLNLRRAFFRDHILVHTHIPKTAGSALSAGLAGIVGAIHTVDRRLSLCAAVEDMSKQDMDDTYFITSHMGFGLHALFDRTPLYVAAVRHPVDRAVSYYRYLHGRPNDPNHVHAVGHSFEDSWHALDKALGPSRRNIQARMLISPLDEEPIDENLLWQRVNQDFFLIIPHRKLDRAMTNLQAAFGVPKAPLAKVNVSQSDPVDPSPEIRRKILEANDYDLQVYDHMMQTFDDKLAQACDMIAEKVLKPL